MIKFAEEQKLAYAIAANLTIVEYIHNKVFGFVPDKMVSYWINGVETILNLIDSGKWEKRHPICFLLEHFGLLFYTK